MSSDAYTAYYTFASEHTDAITLAGCLMHARRPFAQSAALAGAGSMTEEEKAALPEYRPLQLLGQIFAIENELKNLSADERKERRTVEVRPLMDEYFNVIHSLNPEKPEPYAFFGELGLDGSLRPVRGILPGTLQASADGFQAVFLPKENLREGTLAEDIAVIGASDIREVINILRRDNPLTAAAEGIEYSREPEDAGPDFSDLQGLPSVRLASMAAAAGGHNLLFIGPAGTGKTMAARRLPSILPPMSREESLEVSKLYSICGMLDPDAPLITKRPFRSPHHSITKAALIGGGSRPQPGEVSLASACCFWMSSRNSQRGFWIFSGSRWRRGRSP